MLNDLGYKGIIFSISKKGYSKIEKKIILAFMYFVKKKILVFPIRISKQKF